MNTYVYEYRGGEIIVTIHAEDQEKAEYWLKKILSKSIVKRTYRGIVCAELWYTWREFWELVDVVSEEEEA